MLFALVSRSVIPSTSPATIGGITVSTPTGSPEGDPVAWATRALVRLQAAFAGPHLPGVTKSGAGIADLRSHPQAQQRQGVSQFVIPPCPSEAHVLQGIQGFGYPCGRLRLHANAGKCGSCKRGTVGGITICDTPSPFGMPRQSHTLAT